MEKRQLTHWIVSLLEESDRNHLEIAREILAARF